jgi:hypothetical protein
MTNKKRHNVTLVTRGIVYLMAFAVFSICAFLLPEIGREETVANPNHNSFVPFLIGAWVLSVPIFIALRQVLKLLNYIDAKSAFTERSIKALQNIKLCALIFGVLIVISALAGVLIGRSIDPTEDFTPIFTLGFIFTFTSGMVATFAAVMEKLLQDAINIKKENELTI